MRPARAATAPLVACLALWSATSAMGQECDIPHSGPWNGISSTTLFNFPAFGAAPGPEQLAFTLEAKGCGEVIYTEGLADPRVMGTRTELPRTSDGEWSRTFALSQGKAEVTLRYEGPASISGELVLEAMGGKATITLEADFDLQDEALRDPRCGCPAFRESLLAYIGGFESFIALYSDPIMYSAPEGWPRNKSWRARDMEKAINIASEEDLTASEALSRLVAQKHGGGAVLTLPQSGQTAAPAGGTASSDGSGGSGGYKTGGTTECDTCQMDIFPEKTGCGRDLANEAILDHELYHQSECNRRMEKYKEDRRKNIFSSRRDCVVMNVAENLAREEIEAYKISIKSIRKNYLELCGEPLE